MSKVNNPKSNTTIIWTPIFERYVVKCGSMKWHQIDICFEEIEHAQKLPTILGSIINMIGGTYVTLNEHKNLRFE